jgi:tetratricopeptide (TPR) repeat protein
VPRAAGRCGAARHDGGRGALSRLGRIDEAIATAELSLNLAEESGDDALAGDAMHLLAFTLVSARPPDAVDLVLRLIERASANPVLQAKAFLVLGIARMRTRDDVGAADAYREALRIARDAQALDVAAGASMNLGVTEMRGGDFASAHVSFHEALRLYTTLRNNTYRLAALYNLANLEWERGDTEAAATLYAETSTLAEQLGADDIAIGAHAGAGLVALRLNDTSAARTALTAAQRMLGARADWWFQGRERFETLTIRLATIGGNHDLAQSRFHAAVARLEGMDVYSAAWMVADCAATLGERDAEVWSTVTRLSAHSTVQQFVPLAARYTALRDLADRSPTARLREGRASTPVKVGAES